MLGVRAVTVVEQAHDQPAARLGPEGRRLARHPLPGDGHGDDDGLHGDGDDDSGRDGRGDDDLSDDSTATPGSSSTPGSGSTSGSDDDLVGADFDQAAAAAIAAAGGGTVTDADRSDDGDSAAPSTPARQDAAPYRAGARTHRSRRPGVRRGLRRQ